MTDNLKPLVKELSFTSLYKIEYYTGPASSPPEISDLETSLISTNSCLPELESQIDEYDGFLIACYSDHPLIYKLRELTSKPVLGIFAASIMYALAYTPTHKFAILTSNNEWEKLLNESLHKFFYGKEFNSDNDNMALLPSFVEPTLASNINVLELKDPEKFEELQNKVSYLVNEKGVKIILLGCAGLSGLDKKFCNIFEGVIFVDTVKIGVGLLVSLLNLNMI
ncbi:hypothetical protein PACTADRAFT_32800 [Pachysolen tannophilus NRRL Y-2460]|uniref:Uncharacterized protein n=1 Tax=Pachysolen tannophilus NRRL Y-2460 TaxID=669874 RepID=A0A1E4U013_PACTA|nr:hypothetical protein PACTADRAFT_32800 [Pachysolen tannophilus NRRL Y-2460]